MTGANTVDTQIHHRVLHAMIVLFAKDIRVRQVVIHAHEVLAVILHALVLEAHVIVLVIEVRVLEVHVANLEVQLASEVRVVEVHAANLEVCEFTVHVLTSARCRRHELMASRYHLTVRIPGGLFNPLQGTAFGQTVSEVFFSGYFVHSDSSSRNLAL